MTIQIQGSSFGSWRFRSKNIRQVSFFAGAALFVRTNFFKQIGGFDDANFFFYNDDIDFAKQVKRHKKNLSITQMYPLSITEAYQQNRTLLIQ